MGRGRLKKRPALSKEANGQKWGELIRELRECRGWSRAELLARYQKKLEGLNPDYQFSEIPSDSWLARVERGESVTVSRQNILVICDALECTQSEKVTIMLGADRNIFADPNGEMTLEGEVLAHAMGRLLSNAGSLHMIHSRLQGRQAHDLSEDDLFTTLLEILQKALHEKRERKPTNRQSAKTAATTATA